MRDKTYFKTHFATCTDTDGHALNEISKNLFK